MKAMTARRATPAAKEVAALRHELEASKRGRPDWRRRMTAARKLAARIVARLAVSGHTGRLPRAA